MTHLPLLSLLIWIPVLGAILVLFFHGEKRADAARTVALVTVIITLLLCVPLYTNFDQSVSDFQFREYFTWIPVFKINYDLGVDGISMPLVLLTCFTSLMVILASWTMVRKKVAQYLSAFLILQGMVVGVFASIDSMLFYFFWEGMLIPMYLSIGIWGAENRSYAAIKFFLYTFFGSALLLIGIIYLGLKGHGFSVLHFYSLPLSMREQVFIFCAFFLAFAIKIPMWPLHTWLPDAHTEAPAGGSVVLAALMLKIGSYGFLRYSLPILPDACRLLAWPMVILSLIAIIYIGFIAIVQTDMKKLIAYSSIAHMGFVSLGSFMIYINLNHGLDMNDAYLSLEGAMVQMVSHAFGSGAMFLAFGVLYQQMHTRQIHDFGGIANSMPVFAAFFMVFALSNVGLPGTSGFVGEFMVILSIFKSSFWVTFFAASTLVIGVAYTLWMYSRVFYGEIAHVSIRYLQDVRGFDLIIFILLAAAVLWLGIFPNTLLNIFHASTGNLLELSLRSKLPIS